VGNSWNCAFMNKGYDREALYNFPYSGATQKWAAINFRGAKRP